MAYPWAFDNASAQCLCSAEIIALRDRKRGRNSVLVHSHSAPLHTADKTLEKQNPMLECVHEPPTCRGVTTRTSTLNPIKKHTEPALATFALFLYMAQATREQGPLPQKPASPLASTTGTTHTPARRHYGACVKSRMLVRSMSPSRW